MALNTHIYPWIVLFSRLQQAQRDAFANEVLRDFDLKQLTGMKKSHDELAESGISDPTQVKSALIQQLEGVVKKDDKKDDLIHVSSDEEQRKEKASKREEAAGSDSSDIQVLSEVEQDEDDPDNSGKEFIQGHR